MTRTLTALNSFCTVMLLAATVAGAADLARIEIQPDDFSVYPGLRISFTATGYDAGDNQVLLVDPTWSGSGGPLTPNGNSCYLDTTDIGTHSITCSKDGVSGSATFRILGPLHRIDVTPAIAYLEIGESVELTADGFDVHDNPVAITDLQWSATSGTITAGGGKISGYTATYTATENGTHTATASDQGVNGTASMVVGGGAGPLTRIVLLPASATVRVGQTRQFSASGYDTDGIEVAISPTWSATGGTITPNGLYTAGSQPGSFIATATAEGISKSAPVTISAGQLTRVATVPRDARPRVGVPFQFSAAGYDTDGIEVAISPTWSATGGTIISDPSDPTQATYTATREGDHIVTAAVAGSAITGQAGVHVGLDSDGDGATDTGENAAPNSGDGNGDGVPDSEQVAVTSLHSATGTGYVTIVTDCAGQQVNTRSEAAQGPQDDLHDYPLGVLGMTLPCATATVTVYFHGIDNLGGLALGKYGPTTPGDPTTTTWYELLGVVFGTAQVDGQTVATAAFTLVDGELGDATAADGQIIDPAGIAVPMLRVPVVAHLEGVGGSVWRSDLAISNPSDRDLTIEQIYRPSADKEMLTIPVIPPHGTLFVEDVVQAGFGAGEGRGPLTVSTPSGGWPPPVVSRTYSAGPDGNLGQGIPGLRAQPAGITLMTGLFEDAAFRSNIAVMAAGDDVTATFDLLRGSEGEVMSGVEKTITAGTTQQWRFSNLFPGLALEGVPMAVRVTTSAPAIAYASLVDNQSTDAVTTMAATTRDDWVVPVIARIPGAQGTFWRSDLALTNSGGEPATISFEYLPEGADSSGGGQIGDDLILAPSSTILIQDVAGAVFAVDNGKGVLILESSQEIVATTRVYTDRVEGGTSGHAVAAVSPGVFSSAFRALTGIRSQGGFRSNIGIVTAGSAAVVTLVLYDADGAELARTTVNVPARSLLQRSTRQLFGAVDPDPAGAVEITTSAPILTYLSVVDPSSQDPAYVLQRGVSISGLDRN